MTEAEQKTVQKTPGKIRKNWKKLGIKVIDVIIVAFILVVCGIYAVHQLTNSTSAAIMVNSTFAANGRNPDGTAFDIMELLHDDVLNSAAEKLDEKMTVQELRSHLTVSDTMSGSSYLQLEQSIHDGEEENNYFPTGYQVTYSIVSEDIRDEGIAAQCKSLLKSVYLPSKTEILRAVLVSYQEYYEQKHLSYDALFDIDWSAADEMDYYNRAEFMEDTVLRLQRFLNTRNSTHISRPEVNGSTSIYDLIVESEQGPISSIKNYQVYVIQNGVTNDREELLRQFAYMQDLHKEENTRAAQRYLVLRDAIEMYDSTTTKVVFIPALDDEKSFYMNRTKVGLDYLTEQADDTKLQADTAAYEANQYAELLKAFGAGYDTPEDRTDSKSRNTPAQKAYADQMYESIKAEIQRLAAEAELLAKEGNRVNQETLRIGEPGRSVGMVGVAMSTAKRFVLLLMAAYVVMYPIRVVTGKKTQAEQEGEA